MFFGREVPFRNYPDPWDDLESRSPLRVPRNYPKVVCGIMFAGSQILPNSSMRYYVRRFYFLDPARGLGTGVLGIAMS